ncbi:MAG: hypothetical protein AAGJ82_12680 [Bacteroidota bacterium]
MWIRLTAILLCVVFFITGCNSLISQFFGTHKLRTFPMFEVVQTGIGDADFVSLEGAWQTGDYLVVPPRNKADKAVLIYPLLTEIQLAAVEKGELVEPRIIAWTKNFSLDCDEENNCAPRQRVDALGIVREMRREKKKAHMLPSNKYRLPENVDYVEVGRSPLAWYWNLLMLVGGLGLAFFIESRAAKKRAALEQQ